MLPPTNRGSCTETSWTAPLSQPNPTEGVPLLGVGKTGSPRVIPPPQLQAVLGNAVKHFLGSYRRQTVVNREGGYLRPRSGERSYDVFAVNCSMNILNGVTTRGTGRASGTPLVAAEGRAKQSALVQLAGEGLDARAVVFQQQFR